MNVQVKGWLSEMTMPRRASLLYVGKNTIQIIKRVLMTSFYLSIVEN